MKKPLIPLVATLVVLGLGLWYTLVQRRLPAPPAPPVPAAASVAPTPLQPPTHYPVPNAPAANGASTASLPALAASDPALRVALTGLIGADAVKEFLAPDQLIRRIVVTVDNLPRSKVPYDRLPVATTPGAFLVEGDAQHATLDVRNYARYTPLVDVLRKLDMRALAKVYFHLYPLFESAYQDLGYPDGYFNDRLIATIDLVLAAPQPQGPIDLVQPHVQYHFADPRLEALPAAEKILIRMGPANAAIVKAKLTELRAALTAAPMAH